MSYKTDLLLDFIEKPHQAGDFVSGQGRRCDFQVPRPPVHLILILSELGRQHHRVQDAAGNAQYGPVRAALATRAVAIAATGANIAVSPRSRRRFTCLGNRRRIGVHDRNSRLTAGKVQAIGQQLRYKERRMVHTMVAMRRRPGENVQQFVCRHAADRAAEHLLAGFHRQYRQVSQKVSADGIAVDLGEWQDYSVADVCPSQTLAGLGISGERESLASAGKLDNRKVHPNSSIIRGKRRPFKVEPNGRHQGIHFFPEGLYHTWRRLMLEIGIQGRRPDLPWSGQRGPQPQKDQTANHTNSDYYVLNKSPGTSKVNAFSYADAPHAPGKDHLNFGRVLGGRILLERVCDAGAGPPILIQHLKIGGPARQRW